MQRSMVTDIIAILIGAGAGILIALLA